MNVDFVVMIGIENVVNIFYSIRTLHFSVIIKACIDDTNPCRSILEGLLEPSHPFEKEVADEAAALFLSSFLGDTCLWDEKPLSFISISCCFYHRTKEENMEMCWNLTCDRYMLLL